MSNPNVGPECGNGVQSLAYVSFIIEKRYRVDEVAEKMGIASDTLYKYIRGEHSFPAERIAALTKATGDPRYLDYIADLADMIVIPKPCLKAAHKSIRQLEVAVAVEQGHLLDATETALEDGKISAADLKRISEEGADVVRAVEALKQAIKGKRESEGPK